MTATEIQAAAHDRACNGRPNSNYATILRGFTAKGIAADDIEPRHNVFTYNAWKHVGRQVRKGEHGVRVMSYCPIAEKRDSDGNVTRAAGSAPRSATVFHVSQTDAIGGAS